MAVYNATQVNTWLNHGDNAWQLTAASLVSLQSIPGLTILYGGIVKKKWAVNSAFMVMYAFAAVLLCWVLWGYKVAFGTYMLPMAGIPDGLLTIDNELDQAVIPTAGGLTAAFPMATMAYFQFVFAAITLVILAGALLARMNFLAWMIFVPLWLSFSYCVGAFSLWGGGFLWQLGVIDYSGGYVIHVSSGTAGFVGAYWVGPRLAKDRLSFEPNNILMVLAGAGILWTGWNGFNGGDPYAASADAGAAVLNTNVATATSLLVWTMMDMIFFKKPSVIGAVQGMITGLVAITPAAGVVHTWGAIIIGICSGSIPWVSMMIVGRKWKLMHKVDDCLGVVHTHMVAGIIGGFLTGVLATVDGCAAFGLTNPGGAIAGNWKQVWYQIVGFLFIVGWNIAWTSIIMLFIKYVCRVPLRMSDEMLEIGDDAVHGEEAYAFYGDGRKILLDGDWVRTESTNSLNGMDTAEKPVSGDFNKQADSNGTQATIIVETPGGHHPEIYDADMPSENGNVRADDPLPQHVATLVQQLNTNRHQGYDIGVVRSC